MTDDILASPDEASGKRLHDLRAPLITLSGFSSELADAIGRLAELFEQHRSLLPDGFLAQAGDVLAQDVGPCLAHVQAAADRLGRAIDELSAHSRAASGA